MLEVKDTVLRGRQSSELQSGRCDLSKCLHLPRPGFSTSERENSSSSSQSSDTSAILRLLLSPMLLPFPGGKKPVPCGITTQPTTKCLSPQELSNNCLHQKYTIPAPNEPREIHRKPTFPCPVPETPRIARQLPAARAWPAPRDGTETCAGHASHMPLIRLSSIMIPITNRHMSQAGRACQGETRPAAPPVWAH